MDKHQFVMACACDQYKKKSEHAAIKHVERKHIEKNKNIDQIIFLKK